MIRRFLRIVNGQWEGMHQAALLLGVFSLVSQLIGLFRDRMLAHTIGPSSTLDIYYAAFRIPDLIYLSIASLASITVLMPFLIQRIDGDGKEAARAFFNDILSGFLLLLGVVCIAVFIGMPWLAHLIAPGFSPTELSQLIGVSRIMLLSPIFMGLSNMLGTVTQLLRKFLVFSLSPIFYNLGIVFGLLVLYPRYGVYGLAFGVAIGALMHMLIQVPTILKAGFTPRLNIRFGNASVRQVVTLSLPRTLGLSMNSIALLVIVALGSTLGTGSISIFNFSLNLETTPVGIIGIAYAVASFPLLAETFSRGEMAKWQSCIIDAVRQIIFWSLPIMSLIIVLRAQIVRITLGSGAFSWNDTRLTAASLALFTVGLIAQNMILVSVRAFYSAHNTKTPLFINALCSIGIILLAFILLHAFKTVPSFRMFFEHLLRVDGVPGTEVLMLPLAYSIGTSFNALLHWIDLRKKYLTQATNLGRTTLESILAALATGLAAYLVLQGTGSLFGTHTFWGVFGQGTLSCLTGIIAGSVVLYLLKNQSFFELIEAARKKFWKVDLSKPATPVS